jgi:hypothetical protein
MKVPSMSAASLASAETAPPEVPRWPSMGVRSTTPQATSPQRLVLRSGTESREPSGSRSPSDMQQNLENRESSSSESPARMRPGLHLPIKSRSVEMLDEYKAGLAASRGRSPQSIHSKARITISSIPRSTDNGNSSNPETRGTSSSIPRTTHEGNNSKLGPRLSPTRVKRIVGMSAKTDQGLITSSSLGSGRLRRSHSYIPPLEEAAQSRKTNYYEERVEVEDQCMLQVMDDCCPHRYLAMFNMSLPGPTIYRHREDVCSETVGLIN